MLLTMSVHTTTEPSNPSKPDAEQVPAGYKGWSICTKLINGKLWLRWQHPKENIPRYGCPVNEEGLASTIDHIRLMIDLMEKLESEVHKYVRIEG